MTSLFLSQMGDFGSGATRGVTERGYTFFREGLQKWVFRVCTGEGVKYYFFKNTPDFY